MASDRYPRSEEWLQRALRVTPNASQTRSKRFLTRGFPAVVSRARNAHVWDVDGHEYIDWIAGLGAVSLGYWDDVENAGRSYPLPHIFETLYAERLLEALRWPEQVRFVKTGSEATEAAMMIARRATGRRLILSVGYHGWHTCHEYSSEYVDVPWGNVPALGEAETAPLAAIIIEPHRSIEPPPGYWLGVRAFCDRTGALLILDEMLYGFRWAIGGATEYWGLQLQPDLACYGKGMANGWPLGCVVGKRDLMEHATPLVSSTFGGETGALGAALRTLDTFQQGSVIPRLWAIGERLKKEIPGVSGYGCRPVMPGSDALLRDAAAGGVLLHYSPAPTIAFNPMWSHSDADVARTVDVLARAVSYATDEG